MQSREYDIDGIECAVGLQEKPGRLYSLVELSSGVAPEVEHEAFGSGFPGFIQRRL